MIKNPPCSFTKFNVIGESFSLGPMKNTRQLWKLFNCSVSLKKLEYNVKFLSLSATTVTYSATYSDNFYT